MQERRIGYIQTKDFFPELSAETVLEKWKAAFKEK